MPPKQVSYQQHYFLFDQDLLSQLNADSFAPGLYERQQRLTGKARGRGTTYFVELDLATGRQECVLRHYHRGGFVARFNKDRYQWIGLRYTRAWREWQLLNEMFQRKLPVPQPIAAHVQRHGLFYTADIITLRVRHAESLAQRLQQAELNSEYWCDIGTVIKRFHTQGIYHADLNAHNILLTKNNECYVIDFDKGEKRQPNAQWQQSNLDRLLRSLKKLSGTVSPFYFNENSWQELLQAYSSS